MEVWDLSQCGTAIQHRYLNTEAGWFDYKEHLL